VRARTFAALVWLGLGFSSSCGAGGGATDGRASDAGDGGASDGGGVDRVDPTLALCARYQAQLPDAGAVPFQIVQQIFDDNCVTCHSGGAALDLSAGVSFAHIVNHAAPAVESCGGILITPGDPAASYLYQKLTVAHPCAGMQMPLDELFASQPLPDCVTGIVRAWILAGAPGN
jgi:hypothetical protein